LLVWDGWTLAKMPPPGTGPPRVHTQHRDYFLFTGELRGAQGFHGFVRGDDGDVIASWSLSPSLWWPEDRAWCVGTDIDGYSTYIACGHECLKVLRREPRIEVLPVRIDDRVDPSQHLAGDVSDRTSNE
jgi:hypothetical protein